MALLALDGALFKYVYFPIMLLHSFLFFFVVSLHICCFDIFYGFSGILFSDLIFISVLSLSSLISLRNILFSDIFCSSP
jgi:hypothetical protein